MSFKKKSSKNWQKKKWFIISLVLFINYIIMPIETKLSYDESQKDVLQNALKDVIKEKDWLEKSIRNMNPQQLVMVIRKNFQENGSWKPFQEIKNHPAYPFLVQMSIDMLDIYDNSLQQSWWIDGKYGKGTTRLVKEIQKKFDTQSDGQAGSDFFQKVIDKLSDQAALETLTSWESMFSAAEQEWREAWREMAPWTDVYWRFKNYNFRSILNQTTDAQWYKHFKLKPWVEKQEANWKTYIELNWQRFYKWDDKLKKDIALPSWAIKPDKEFFFYNSLDQIDNIFNLNQIKNGWFQGLSLQVNSNFDVTSVKQL